MKRTLSKVLSCILAVMMVLSVVSTTAFAATGCGEGKHTSDGKIYGTEDGKYCYEYSYVTKYCTVCKQYYAEFARVITGEGHTKDDATVTLVKEVPATCNSKGVKEHYECSLCGWKSLDGTTPIAKAADLEIAKSANHQYVADLKTVVEPKVADGKYVEGSMTYVCELCGDTKVLPITCAHEETYSSAIEDYDFTAENWKALTGSTNYKKPTCTADGFQVYQCNDCKLTFKVVLTAAHEGDLQAHEDATCTREGYDAYICKVCNKAYTEVLPMKNHKDEKGFPALEKIAEATCTANSQWLCSVCKETLDNKKVNGADDKLGHPGKIALPEYNQYASKACASGVKYQAAYFCPVCEKAEIGGSCTVNGEEKAFGLVFVETTTGTSHDFSVKEFTEQATCIKDGKYVLKCSKCGQYADKDNKPTTDDSKAKVNTMKAADADHDVYTAAIIILPTCVSDGVKQIACRLCDKLDGKFETIPATGHVYDEAQPYEIVRSSSCSATGVNSYICDECDQEILVPTSKLEHVFSSAIFYAKAEPTCTKVGYTEDTRYCTLCGALEFPENEIAKKGHTQVKVTTTDTKGKTVNATCTAWGYVASKTKGDGWYCTVEGCGAVDGKIVTSATAPLGHDITKVYDSSAIEDGVCASIGYTTYVCTRCDFKSDSAYVTDYAKNADHKLATIKATTADTNFDVYVDDELVTVKVLKGKTGVDASCTSIGFTVAQCSNCKNYYATDIKAKKAHTNADKNTFNEVENSSSILCIDGFKASEGDYKCTVCKEDYTKNVVHRGKTQKINAYDATCTQPEYTVYAWECCGDIVTEVTSPELGHDWATETVNGVEVTKCQRCGATNTKTADADLEYIFDINGKVVNGGKLAVTVSIKNTSSAIDIVAASLKFNYDAEAFTLTGVEVAEGSQFDTVTAIANTDKITVEELIGYDKDLNALYNKVDKEIPVVVFNALNSDLAEITIDAKYELATLYFDVAGDAREEGKPASFAFGVEDEYAEKNVAANGTDKYYIQAGDADKNAFVANVALLGDLDADGYVTIADYVLMLKAFDNFAEAAELAEADINCDGTIDAADVDAVRLYVNGTTATYEEMVAGA